ncbi:MAG: hypothetical protein QM741_10210 [Rudaea sp.]|uniref:hypothetical protein n=1 Tax=Rudaea sp. TaxID=2136325 RepID=UPI0039E61DFD
MTGTRALWLVAAGTVGPLIAQEGGSWWLLALGAASFDIMWLCVCAQTLAAPRKAI